MSNKIRWIWGLAFLGLLIYLAVIAGSLPDNLAVHFDMAGRPNGFQSRATFLTMILCFSCFINGMILALFYGIDQLPPANINIPWKQYWFATPERQAMAYDRLRAVLVLTGLFICTVFLFVEHIVYQENTPNAAFVIPINAGVGLILILSVLFICASVVITKPPMEE